MKKCKICNIEKDDICFEAERHQCRACRSQKVKDWKLNNKKKNSDSNKQYQVKNKTHIQEVQKQWYVDNKEKVLEYQKTFYSKNKEKIKKYVKRWCVENANYVSKQRTEYRLKNKIIISKNKMLYQKNRRLADSSYKLRQDFSSFINLTIRRRGSSKAGISIFHYLSYTIQELKEHLEKQFEPWMTWDNRGVYKNNEWNNDPSTWTWQIDHIIPNSHFKYSSMKDQAFKDCWGLSNLRPLSAKQNILDGAKRIRQGG